jgi:hypothetical protein
VDISNIVISVFSTLVGGAIAGIGRAFWDRIPYQTISHARAKALRGHWEGVVQELGNKASVAPSQVSISFEFKPGAWRRVGGKSTFASLVPERGQIINDYKGGFYQDQYLMMDYRKHDAGVTGFGAVILELSADSRTLEGYFVGYSSHNARLFVSDVTLHKKI